ncbi:MAG TPA: amino acid permease [Planctomycetota bacterium]
MNENEGPRRALGPVHATGIVVGAIIGVGIFLTPGKVAAIAGSPGQAMLMWAVGGAIALCGALALAEVGARFPTSGGQLVALRRMLGPLPAFLYGWSLLLAIQTGVLALITLFAAQNLAALFGAEWSALAISGIACAMLATIAAANLLGARQGAAVQTSTSLLKLVVLGALAAIGLAVAAGLITPEPAAIAARAAPDAARPPWIAGLAAVLFSYGGFHQLTWVGGEVRRAERTVPLAIVLGVGIVIAAYLAANSAYFALLPYQGVVDSPSLAADAVGTVLPGWGRRLVAAALCVSAYGIANASLLTAPRVYYALAREGLFFRALGRLNPSSGVPRLAILLQTGLAMALLAASSLQLGSSESGAPLTIAALMDQLVNGVVFVDWSFHILTCAGLLLLRRRETARGTGYRAPGGALAPLAFLICASVALGATFLDPGVRASSSIGVGVIAAGALVYAFGIRRRARAAR